MKWQDVDWKLLEELRAPFLSQQPLRDYWNSRSQLEHYDLTFAQRIGWKWNSVLTEVKQRELAPGTPKPWLVDWGCGTGIASRRVLAAWPDHFAGVHYWDRSKLAETFAAEKSRQEFPSVTVGEPPAQHPRWLLLSHVIGELDRSELPSVFSWLSQASIAIWVEPGTSSASRQLINVREELRGQFDILAPCPHQAACGLLAPSNASHWCHNFAKAPSEVFQDADWKKFSDRMKIDLRSLPVSFLVMANRHHQGRSPAVRSRVLGRARHYTGYSLYLSCEEAGVDEKKVMKRNDAQWIKFLKDNPFTALRS